jgi:hypothetical protein
VNVSARARTCACLVSMFAALGCDPEVIIGYAPDATVVLDASAIPDSSPIRRDAAAMPDTGAMSDASAMLPIDASVPTKIEITWQTGAHSGSDLADFLAFGEWRGRPLDLASVYFERTRWDGLVMPSWPLDMMRDYVGTLLISLPLYPEGGGNNQDCASGMYDVEWRKLGSFLSARSRGDSILRLGWGWNDLEHDWRANADPADWIACYRRVVSAIRSTGPLLRFEWSFNPPGAPEIMPGDPYAAYPGDEYVDFVSFEVFDMYPPLRNTSEWNAQCRKPGGLCTLFDFARQHGKRVGIGEWGVAACGGDPGGDNDFFVQRMVQAFSENRDLMGYEAYFEDGSDVCSVLKAATQTPRAAARYRALYRE